MGVKGKVKKNSTLFNAMLTYFVLLVLFVVVRILFLEVDFPSSNLADILTTLFVQGGILFCGSVFLFSLLNKQKPRETFGQFGFKKIKAYPIFLCIILGIVCYVLNVFVANFFSFLIEFMGYEKLPSVSGGGDFSVLAFLTQVLTTCLLPAICEETANRGLLLKGSASLGITASVILSSIFFGLMHLNVNQFFYATVLGFILAFSVITTKSIFPGMIIHFMNNFLSTYFSFAGVNNWFLGDLPNLFVKFIYGNGQFLPFLFRCILVVVLIVAVLVILFSMLLKETRIKGVQNMLNDISAIRKEYSASPETFNNDANFMNLHEINNLMGEYNIKSLKSMVFTDLENKKVKPTAREIVVISACAILGGLITLFTFIWGVL